MAENNKTQYNAKKLELNKETISDLEVREQVEEVRRLIGKLPSAANCPSIDGDTCLCRTPKCRATSTHDTSPGTPRQECFRKAWKPARQGSNPLAGLALTAPALPGTRSAAAR